MVQKLLNIKQFYDSKFNKIKTIIQGNWDTLLVFFKSAQWLGFYGSAFIIFRPKV